MLIRISEKRPARKPITRNIAGKLLVSAMVLFGLASSCPAQNSTGAINGTVTDATRAVIPGASVDLTNNATGIQRALKTNSSGVYVINQIEPGTYTISAGKAGFSTVSRAG